jgi:hypothetical protein
MPNHSSSRPTGIHGIAVLVLCSGACGPSYHAMAVEAVEQGRTKRLMREQCQAGTRTGPDCDEWNPEVQRQKQAALEAQRLEREKKRSAAQAASQDSSSAASTLSCAVEKISIKPLIVPTDKAHVRIFFMGVSSDQLTKEELVIASDLFEAYVQVPSNAEMSSMRDMETVIGVEKQKEILGCNEIACMAEIGAALGADFIINGTVGRLGGGDLILSMRAIDAHTSQSAAKAVVRYDKPACVRAALKEAVKDFLK